MAGERCAALIDTGCTRTLVHASLCKRWHERKLHVVTVSGQQLECAGITDVRVAVPGMRRVTVSALVVRDRPLGFAAIVGMDTVRELGGVTVRSTDDVRFGCETDTVRETCAAAEGSCAAVTAAEDPQRGRPLRVDREGFHVTFDPAERRWTVAWDWTADNPPPEMAGRVSEYPVPAGVRAEYEAELSDWVAKGWLREYDESDMGPPMGLIPLMAVVQRNKVRPVMDFRSLNRHVTTHTADADVCAEQTREWRRMGTEVALLDLKKAYLQIHVDKKLWPYQTVMFRGRRHCLTRMAFGMSLSPSVMKAVLETVIGQDERVRAAVSSYVDDILVNETVLPARDVAEHLRTFGLESKEPERAENGARVLGHRVWGERDGHLRWRRDGEVDADILVKPVTKRGVFSVCGQLTGHYPVCGWLRPAASFVKRVVSDVVDGWDEPVVDPDALRLVDELLERVRADDPARGQWDAGDGVATVWTDASSLALGAAIEIGGEVLEDASWLRPRDDVSHINMAELDAVLKGVNLAIQWGVSEMHLMVDSRTVYHWVSDLLSGRARLRSKATSEMLIRRRLGTLKALVDEYGLRVSVSSVSSASNKADILTRVPERWVKTRTVRGADAGLAVASPGVTAASGAATGGAVPADPGRSDEAPGAAARDAAGETADAAEARAAAAACAATAGAAGDVTAGSAAATPTAADEAGAAVNETAAAADTGAAHPAAEDDPDAIRRQVRTIHHTTGHPGIRRTFFFARRVLPGVTKGLVREVVSGCELCRSFDPAPVKWRKGELSVDRVWERVAMDVTHVRGAAYLTLIDCGPSRFSIWRLLRLQTSAAIVEQLESIFLERGAPRELLVDNDPAFRSRRFHAVMARWEVQLRFRCAHVPSGNGIIERCHRSIKVIAARKGCTVAEAVYWYNVAPRDDETAESAPASQLYRYRVRVQGLDEQGAPGEAERAHSRYRPGDGVWVRPPRARCDTRYDRGEVTRVVSDQCVEVNGMPRHVRELRRRELSGSRSEDASSDGDGDEPLLIRPGAVCRDDGAGAVNDEEEIGHMHVQPVPRTSGRVRRANVRYRDCC